MNFIIILFAFILLCFCVLVFKVIKSQKQTLNVLDQIPSKINVSTHHWTPTQAQVVVSEIEERETRSIGQRIVMKYRAHIRYQYEVAQKPYAGVSMIQRWSANQEEIKNELEKYPVGTLIQIKFDPEAPDHSIVVD